MTDSKFELVDTSSGKKADLKVRAGTIGPSVVDIGNINKDLGVFTYDPGFGLTAACDSRITYIDGDAGVLLYRGYPIEQLAEKSSFMEVAYLLLHGDLPNKKQLDDFTVSIRHHTMINETLLRFFNGFHHNAHPMAMVSAVVASMSLAKRRFRLIQAKKRSMTQRRGCTAKPTWSGCLRTISTTMALAVATRSAS